MNYETVEDLFEAFCIMAESEGDNGAWVYFKYEACVDQSLLDALKKKLAGLGVVVF